MKKFVVVVVISLFMLQAVSSQKVIFGFKEGVNLATVKGTSDLDRLDYKKGFHLGGVIEYKLNNKFSLQGEILYSQQGAMYVKVNEYTQYENYDDIVAFTTNQDSHDSANVVFNLVDMFYDDSRRVSIREKWIINYINFPILLSYNFYDNFHIYGGPQIGFLVAGKARHEEKSNRNSDYTYKENYKLKQILTSVDYSGSVGVDYEFANGLFMEARYSISLLNNRYEQPEQYSPVTNPFYQTYQLTNEKKFDKIYNHVMQFSVGYKFL